MADKSDVVVLAYPLLSRATMSLSLLRAAVTQMPTLMKQWLFAKAFAAHPPPESNQKRTSLAGRDDTGPSMTTADSSDAGQPRRPRRSSATRRRANAERDRLRKAA
jgi:hypothetical protein